MSDVVKCKAVLVPRENAGRFTDEFADRLCMVIKDKESGWRDIPVYLKGRPKPEKPAWEYIISGSRLHLTPSLHCVDSGFHTGYNWDVEFETCPVGVSAFDHFFAVNPDIEP